MTRSLPCGHKIGHLTVRHDPNHIQTSDVLVLVLQRRTTEDPLSADVCSRSREADDELLGE
jgi:hypothetical protein